MNRVSSASRYGRRLNIVPYLFLLPYLVVFLTFRFSPILANIFISLTKWEILGLPKWVGLSNYQRLKDDPLFWTALANTVYFVLLSVPSIIICALALAILLNMPLRGRTLGRIAAFAPYVVMVTVVGVLWKWILDSNFGLLNTYLRSFGLPAPPWFTSAQLAMPSIAMANLWWWVGFAMVIFLAGLQDIPGELYEAARIDGASGPQLLTTITLPLLRPTIFLTIIITMINSFLLFGLVFTTTMGGPGSATISLVQYIYVQGIQWFDMGYAAAIAMVLFSLVLLLTIAQFRITRGGYVGF